MKKINKISVVLEVQEPNAGAYGFYRTEIPADIEPERIVETERDERSHPYFIAHQPTSAQEDFLRAEAIMDGEILVSKMVAVAEIEINEVPQIIRTVGDGFFESDSDASEEEIVSAQESEANLLQDLLEEIGFSKDEINAAFETAEFETGKEQQA